MKFKKISAILGSVFLTSMTFGVVAAANFPSPFVDSGVADVAVVYGTGAGVSSLDQVYAGNIKTTLGESVDTTSTTTVVDGESYKFERSSTKLHLGDHYVNITTTLDEDELPTLLADGKYLDNDNDEIDYTQKITMGSLGQLTMFDDDDYKDDSPTVGFKIPSSQTLLTYEIDFSDTLLMTDMPTTELPFMGKSYYVLSNTTTTLTLLDSAASAVLEAGETVTLDVDGNSYTISASIFDTTNSKVKLVVNGVTTNLLASTETQKVGDVYVGIKEVVVQNFAGGANQVEFSIGKGKLVLTDGDESVQVNDNSVEGITADFDLTANELSKINITWTPGDTIYITEDRIETMPEFEILTLSYGGLTYPAEEVIEVKKGGTTWATLEEFPLKDGTYDINFLYGDSTSFTGIGRDGTNHKLVTDSENDGNITFDSDTDDYFVVSWTDTTDAESYLLRASGFTTDGSTDKFNLEYWNGGPDWVTKKSGAKATDTVQFGSVDLTIGAVSNTDNSVELWNTSANTATSIQSFNTLYSKEGLTLYLPIENSTALNITNATQYSAATACAIAAVGGSNNRGEFYTGTVAYNDTTYAVAGIENSTTCTATTWTLSMIEEDKSENKYSGDTINLTIGWDSSTTAEVEVSDVVGEEVTFAEIGDTDVWRSFMYSALATEMLWTKPSSGQKSIKIMYHGDEVEADAYITSPDATITSGGAADVLVVKDTEVNSVKAKNLVIVGGSCINSAAATVLGGAYCGEAFTAATGVAPGQFLIKSVGDAYTAGQVALVVAGYEVADTNNAATYLRTKTVDTTAGKMYIGTSATEATLQVN